MYGLLLVGGKSSRMGSNKSELIFRDGLTQQERGKQLLASVCDQVYLSVADGSDASEHVIADAFGSVGPLGAIASAQQKFPNQTWLILACDLPLLEKSHLEALVDSRDASADATCFLSATDGLPEPLCAIWEPSTEEIIRKAIDAGQRCPRSILSQVQIKSLSAPGLWSLANTNTEADVQEIRARINGTTSKKKINVSYYAQLRELTGQQHELLETESETPAGLFEEIRAKYQLPLKRKGMMVAVNGDFSEWKHPLTEGEEIVFIPPVAGG